MLTNKLGKIECISLGYGGYQDAMFGLSFTLSGAGWGVGDFKGPWAIDTKASENAKWSESDRRKEFADTMVFANDLMRAAKVKTLNDLKGSPVEVSFDGNTMVSWRILEEVL